MVLETSDLSIPLVECLQAVVALPEEDTQVVDPLALQEVAFLADRVVLVGFSTATLQTMDHLMVVSPEEIPVVALLARLQGIQNHQDLLMALLILLETGGVKEMVELFSPKSSCDGSQSASYSQACPQLACGIYLKQRGIVFNESRPCAPMYC